MARASNFVNELDWNLLKTFHVIVECGNLTRAARALSRKQPAISLSLRRLEAMLGCQLCERSATRFELTPEGLLVAEACHAIVDRVGGLTGKVADLSKDIRGHIRIATISNITSKRFNKAIAAFHCQCPRVRLDIDVVAWEDVNRRLYRGAADVGIAAVRFQRADLDYMLLYRELHRLYCGRPHHLFGTTVSDPAELADDAFILTGADEADVITEYRMKHGLGRIVSGVSEYLDEAKRLAIQGLGLCFLPESYVEDDVAAGRLWQVMSPEHAYPLDVYLITPPVERLQLPTRLFYEHLISFEETREPTTKPPDS
jgi:DNA-binding transcriptional LysR family regulator